MDEHTRIAYNALREKEARLLVDLSKTRSMLEQLAAELGEELPELDASIQLPDSSAQIGTPSAPQYYGGGRQVPVKTGEFYNKSLSDATKTYLERKGEAAPFPEIIDALKRGGFVMKSGEAEEARLRLNLLKSVNFVLIPDNNFGLSSQYGKARRQGKKRGRPKGS